MLMEKLALWPGRSDVTLTAYVSLPDPGWPFPTEAHPAVIICPGGAYLNLSAGESAPVALALAARGYQAFVLEYSVASRVEKAEQCRRPAQLMDLAKAMVTVRENAEKWNLDGNKIAVMGFSAGGHLCAEYATHWHEPWLAEAIGVNSTQLRPDAAVLGYAITDYMLQKEQAGEHDPMFRASHQAFLGGNLSDEMLEQVSPCRHVGKHTPPMFLVHAADDGMVPVAHSLQMAQALTSAGVSCEMHMFQQGDHGFGVGHPMDRPWEAHRNRACAAWLDLAHTWLLKQFSPETKEPPLPSAEEFFRALEAKNNA
ncbi:MAG: alpha/beta hydrolase [Oscillospiraceae bacterium]|nr:alpha/beta hydrolase [Oscillospiraceae bacterium]